MSNNGKTHFNISPVSKSTPFDNTSNGFTATDAQTAIEEAKLTAANASRGPTVAGFDGNASTGRWLEFYSNNPSDSNPFIVAENSQLIAVSIVTGAATATGTAAIKRNGTTIQSISLTAQKKNAVDSLALNLVPLDELSIQISSGSISRPTVYMFIRTLPS